MTTNSKQIQSLLCVQHKEKCLFVCLHKTCISSFIPSCSKCKKAHNQHPNRLIPINELHEMILQPIKYIENASAYKLINLKKKIEYIRNFRTFILQKEIQLLESNTDIKSSISTILLQHQQIRDVLIHINSEAMNEDWDRYCDYLQKTKEFMAFNPIKGNLVFNNDNIKVNRLNLQKYVKKSNEHIDSMREFLIKIIQVLLANCVHDEDDDEIQYDSNGDDPLSFNIYVKSRVDVSECSNIKSKIQNENFFDLFDEEKDSLTKEIGILEKQLNFKLNILNRVKQSRNITHSYAHSTIQQKNQEQQVNQYKQEIAQKDIQMQELNKIISNYKEQLNKQQAKIRQLSIELNQVSTTKDMQIDESKQIIQKIVGRLSELQNQIRTYNHVVLQKDERIQSLTQQILKMQNLLQATNYQNYEKNEANQKKISQLQLTIKKITQELFDSQGVINKQSAKSSRLQKTIKQLQSQKNDCNKQLQENRQLIAKYQCNIEQLERFKLQNSINSRLMINESVKRSMNGDSTFSKIDENTKKYKQLKQMLQLSIKKSQQLKDKVYELQIQNKQLKNKSNLASYRSNQQTKRRVSDGLNYNSNQMVNTSIDQSIQTYPSIDIDSKIQNPQPLKEKHFIQNNEEKRQAYLQIKNIFELVNSDMKILQEKVRENNIVQQVYLKQLQKKRSENRHLKKQLEIVKSHKVNQKDGFLTTRDHKDKSNNEQQGKRSPAVLNAKKHLRWNS